MLDQRWADVVHMLYNCFVYAGSWSGIAYCWRRLQAETDPMYVKCWASVAGAGQYPFSTSQYFMLPVAYLYAGGTGTMLWTKAGLMLAAVCDAGPHSAWRQTRHDNPIMG